MSGEDCGDFRVEERSGPSKGHEHSGNAFSVSKTCITAAGALRPGSHYYRINGPQSSL